MRLSSSATTKIASDKLVADLTAPANSPAAVAAQHRVNSLMAEAGREAGGVNGVKSTFRAYSVQCLDGRPPNWIAQQTLKLRGGKTETLLGQALGLTIGSLARQQVSPDPEEKARRNATITALKSLRTWATDPAAALDMEVYRFQWVRLNGRPGVLPLRWRADGRGSRNGVRHAAAQRHSRPAGSIADVSAEVVMHATPASRSSDS